MTRELTRRTTLRALAAAGVVGLGGCNFGGSASGGGEATEDGAGGGGTSGGGSSSTPTPEPPTWPEATRQVLDSSTVETIGPSKLGLGAVETRGDAERVFSAVGWYTAASNLDGGQSRQIETFLERSGEIERTLRDIEDTLGRLDALVGEMKNTEIPVTGTSVWEAATTLSPSLQGFDVAVSESLGEVRTWLGLLGDVTDSVERVQNAVRSVRNGQVSQASGLDRAIQGAVENSKELESRSTEMQRTLSNYAQVTGQVATTAGQLGPLAEKVGRVYGDASEQLDRAASELRAFNEQLRGAQSTLSTLRSNAEETASNLLARADALDPVPVDSDGGGGTTPTPTPTPTPQSTPTEPDSETEERLGSGWEEGFEKGPGNWSGDTGPIQPTSDAARGSRAVKFVPQFATATLDVPDGTGGTYAYWWKVGSEQTEVVVSFQDGTGTGGFDAAIESGRRLELVINSGTVESDEGRVLYTPIQVDTWYRLLFTNVDFREGTFEVVLEDFGQVELTRIELSFRNPIDSVSDVLVKNMGTGATYLDEFVIE